MTISRREFIAASVALPWAAASNAAAPTTAIIGILQEPTQLASALTTAGPTQQVSTKIFDGLLYYDLDSRPQPQLATSWHVSGDGLRITFQLRPGVRWHDGHPFTSEDIAFSVLEVWKKYHSRGRSTYANVTRVETPDPLTAVLVLSKPAPYLLSALASSESQPVPQHLYSGSDPLANPHNLAPVGTGPFRFVSWQHGSHIVLERNPDYWDAPRPNLDRLIIRFLPQAVAIATALETGTLHLGTPNFQDLIRLKQRPELVAYLQNTPFNTTLTSFEFNLDRPQFRDPRVRQAFAHAIDRRFLLTNIWHGVGVTADSPIPPSLTSLHADHLPAYDFDLAKAQALLERAGLKRSDGGTRLSLSLDVYPTDYLLEAAQVIRSNLAHIGVRANIRSADPGQFISRIYTTRDFDTTLYGASPGPDPVIGVQRFYWSNNFARGIAFSNGAHYENPRVDAALLAAQTELNLTQRRLLYEQFQTTVQTDAVTLPLIFASVPLVGNRKLRDAVTTADTFLGNFAHATLTG